jgi:hypothetical protein
MREAPIHRPRVSRTRRDAWRFGRAFRICFIAFQAIWLNAVVPGHTRGVVTLGCESDACEHTVKPHSCCPPAAASKNDKPSPTPEQKARCAVCAFAARVTTPPTVSFVPPRLELLCVADVVAARHVESADLRLTYLGRAPPQV